jgi:hypothetical protein
LQYRQAAFQGPEKLLGLRRGSCMTVFMEFPDGLALTLDALPRRGNVPVDFIQIAGDHRARQFRCWTSSSEGVLLFALPAPSW